jgi:hypothetical protein
MADRRRAAVRGLVSVLGAIALFGALLALPRSVASFTAATDNTANTVVADTLDAPTAVLATDGVSISVDWNATVDSYATGYRVLRSTMSGGPFSQIAEIADTNVVTYLDSPPEGSYFYTLRTFHMSWEGNNSSETSGRAWRPFDCPNDPDLRACIRFDEDLGASFADESAYGNTVTHLGASQVPGISGAAAYGAPGSRYEMADSASLDITNALTMEAWLRFDSLPTAGRAGVIDNDGQYSIIYFAGAGLRCGLPDNLITTAFPVGAWFHVACSWDGSTHTMYIDGAPVATGASTGPIDVSNTDPTSVLNTSPAFDEPMDGAMDNLRIWNSGRTQAQICTDAGITTC